MFPPQALFNKVVCKSQTFIPPKLKSGKTLSYNPLCRAPVPADAPVRRMQGVRAPPSISCKILSPESSSQLDSDWTVRYPNEKTNPPQNLLQEVEDWLKNPDQEGFVVPTEANITKRVKHILNSYHRYTATCSNRLPDQKTRDLKTHAQTYGGFEDFHNSNMTLQAMEDV